MMRRSARLVTPSIVLLAALLQPSSAGAVVTITGSGVADEICLANDPGMGNHYCIDGGAGVLIGAGESVVVNAGDGADKVIVVEDGTSSCTCTCATLAQEPYSFALTTITINGQGGADELAGANGPVTFNGNPGNDKIRALFEPDIITGGSGFDSIQDEGGALDLNGNTNDDCVHIPGLSCVAGIDCTCDGGSSDRSNCGFCTLCEIFDGTCFASCPVF